jgi:3-hydroxyisobutyrate dehydrogenase
MTRLAFVGVGRMGLPMGRNLLRAGHEVVAADVDSAALAAIQADGAEVADSPAAAVEAAAGELAIAILPSPAIVEKVLLGDGGMLAALPSGGVLLDMSTGPPELARRLAQAGKANGVEVLDGPVSGGPPGAEAGTLAIMVGGSVPGFERVRPVLETMGSRILHMGGPGSGQATKLCNNLLAGVHMAALAESVAIAQREGLDPHRLLDALRNATGDSRVLRMRFPVPGVLPEAPASRDFAPMFPVDLIAKDLALAIGTAEEHGLDIPMAELALQRYRTAQGQDLGDRDYSVVATLVDPEAV